MSVKTQIDRIKDARNVLREKGVSLGIATNTDNLTVLADKYDAIQDRGTPRPVINIGETYTIETGYYHGGVVSIGQGEADYALQDIKEVTPTKSVQTIGSDAGYYGLRNVRVKAIPDIYQDVHNVDATAADVLVDKIIVSASGTEITGSMPDNGAVTESVAYGGSYTIPAGYHNGSGKVTNGVGAATITAGGSTTTAPKAVAEISNSNNINTITNITDKTQGSDYFDITAKATGTAGSFTPSYTVSTAGYKAYGTYAGVAQDVSVTPDVTGKTIHIPKASFTVSGKSVKVTSTGGGYIPNGAVVGTVADVVGSIGGTASNGAATAAISNVNNINTITAISGKTAGTDYWQIKATASGTKGTYTPEYTVTAAGYLGATVTGTAQDVNVTDDTSGRSLYIPKATFSKSGASVKSSTAGYIPANTTVGTISTIDGSIGGTAVPGRATAAISNVNSMNTITDISGKTAGTDYWAVKATASGTKGTYTPKYTVNTAGYLGSTVTGTAQDVSVSADTTGKSIYIPKAAFTVSDNVVKTTTTGGGYIPANTNVGTVTASGWTGATFNALTQTSVTIPAGYTAGGSVTLTSDLEDALAAI